MKKIFLFAFTSLIFVVSARSTSAGCLTTASNVSFASNTVCYTSRRLVDTKLNCYDGYYRFRYRVKNTGTTGQGVTIYYYDLLGKQIKDSWAPYQFYVPAGTYIDKSMSVRGIYCLGAEVRLVPSNCSCTVNPEIDYVAKWQITNAQIKPCQ